MKQYDNPLLDKEFLIQLDNNRDREVYAKIIALTYQEQPIESIEGKITQGSVNIDGSSAVRRTCSLTMIAEDININDFYWGVKSKFRLEIGLKNTLQNTIIRQYVDENEKTISVYGNIYPEIIWFPQGTFIITSFNTSYAINSYTINIQGKDKMCLLNGDLGGSLTASIDFGMEEFLNLEDGTKVYTPVPIERIIREAVHTYALEPYHNIIINDLDEAAVELLEYRGDVPLYLLRSVVQDEFNNYTDDGNIQIYFTGDSATNSFPISELEQHGGFYDPRIELAPEAQAITPSSVRFKDGGITDYTIAKVEFGQTAGYRRTDLTYAGDLISNVGESLTSIFDKIKNMLGEYEYFYDIDGRFIFQKKKIYTSTSWNNIIKIGDEEYVEPMAYSSSVVYNFNNNNLITSFANNPNLTNLKNDYSVWGQRETFSGAKIPIHYRYAIDKKPTQYTTLNITEYDIAAFNAADPDVPLTTQISQTYTIEDYDWREIIYQMALDYYRYNQLDCYSARLIEANQPLYSNGTTGYEQYYIDLQGFWRQLYDPNPEPYYEKYIPSNNEKLFEALDKNKQPIELFINNTYTKVTDVSKYEPEELLALVEISYKDDQEKQIIRKELIPWLDAIKINYFNTFSEGEDGVSSKYYVAGPNDPETGETTYVPIKTVNQNQVQKSELYFEENGKFVSLLESSLATQGIELYKNDNDMSFIDVKTAELSELYYDKDSNKYYKSLYRTSFNIEGEPEIEKAVLEIDIDYSQQLYKYIRDDDSKYLYWTKDIVEDPSSLNFWFDFLDSESELGQFSIQQVGDRPKAVNDNSVTAIYFREVPNLIFTTYKDYLKSDIKDKHGYTPVFMTGNLEGMFNISSQGKSAKDKLDELLYNHSYCIESVTIQCIPIYYLQPNTRIFIKDELSNINGDYIVSKITLPLAYNGTMSITATKAPERLY